MAKTGNIIIFPIYEDLFKALIEIFPELHDEPKDKMLFEDYNVSHVGKKYRLILRRLKIDKSKRYTLKTFRKTFGTKMASINMPVKDLMYIMGHKEISTTMKYYVKAKSEEIGKKLNYNLDFLLTDGNETA